VCIGCGVCAAVCPRQILRMTFNRDGEYRPVTVASAAARMCSSCGTCLSVCPFVPDAENKDRLAQERFAGDMTRTGDIHRSSFIAHRSPVGYYRRSFAGHVCPDERRWQRSSGGLASWFLQAALNERAVERVICVVPQRSPLQLFRFSVLQDAQAVAVSAKSCYYPVELSSALREVRTTDARYAVIGLPCFLKGIRLAMRSDSLLSRRVILLAGLICGGTRSRFYADYLCTLAGGRPDRMISVDFRTKFRPSPFALRPGHLPLTAQDFGFGFESVPPAPSSVVRRRDIWARRYFEPDACSYCDDTFAEVADVAFMDGWLERYVHDPRGTTLVLIRSGLAEKIFDAGQGRGAIAVTDIPIEDVIESQQGVIDRKQRGLAGRLTLARRLLSPHQVATLWLEHRIKRTSRSAFRRVLARTNTESTEVPQRPPEPRVPYVSSPWPLCFDWRIESEVRLLGLLRRGGAVLARLGRLLHIVHPGGYRA
jgi:coenzyme F420-reducing hydrogenase beta subunit